VVGGAALLTLLLAAPRAGVADQLFHTVRLSFRLTPDGALAGHPALRSGHVVDIHPNGPVNGAHERYQLNGAKPNTAYAVVLRVFTDTCGGAPSGFDRLTTVTLRTDQHGNAQGKFDFPAGPPPPTPLVVGVRWTLVDEQGEVAYDTDCITVGID
jgi:hypothetical protein